MEGELSRSNAIRQSHLLLEQDPDVFFTLGQDRAYRGWKPFPNLVLVERLPVIEGDRRLFVIRNRHDEPTAADAPEFRERLRKILYLQMLQDFHADDGIETSVIERQTATIGDPEIVVVGESMEARLPYDVDPDHLIELAAERQNVEKLACKDTDVENSAAIRQEVKNMTESRKILVSVDTSLALGSETLNIIIVDRLGHGIEL
jgi:hypothetical protein